MGPELLPRRRLVLASRDISYTLRCSRRAKWISLTIRPETGLVVTAPLDAPLSRVEAFLRRHQRWIVRHTQHLDRPAAHAPTRGPYGPTLPYRGKAHRVLIEAGHRRPSVERAAGPLLVVRARQATIESVRRLLKAWYVAEARRRLTERVELLGRQVGVNWRRIAVRESRWRWGSCSPTGHLSFNYRLVMAPPEPMDYVVIHELCHRLELNHSPRFWRLVDRWCPHAQESRAWLKTHGPFLGV